ANSGLEFHLTDNPLLLCYSKATSDLSNVLVMVVNLDPFHKQSGWVTLDLDLLGISSDQSYQAHDLITDSRFVWHGPVNFVELDPESCPVHILRLRKRVHTEEDFDYYL
ncbi:MAG: alpha-1,4-glucan--maltose-1-phosphate maltosyltransferase, partial [Acidobacteriota bacterium]